MRAIILAAGFGTRLRPLTEEIPKPMIPVLGVPNIERTVHYLRSFGVTRLAINLHHLPGPIVDHLGDGARCGVEIAYSREEKILGTGGGIKRAASLLSGDGPVLVVNGDVLFTPDLGEIIEAHRASGAAATMVVREDPRAQKLGVVGLDEENRVGRLVWAGTEERGPRAHMFTGLHVISEDLIPRLPDDGCVVRGTYIPMVDAEEHINGFVTNDYFCDMGTPAAYLEASRLLCMGEIQVRGIDPPRNARHVGRDVTVPPDAVIAPGSSVCDGATIAPGATVEEAIVMPGARVDGDARRCVVLPDGRRMSPDPS